MRLVIDTNTLISGTLWDGAPARLVEAMEAGHVRLVLSAELLAEFADVAGRDKLAKRLALREVTPRKLIDRLARKAETVLPASIPLPPELRDPKDLKVLAAAVAGKVDAIVTGDDDLKSMNSFQGIPILETRVVLEMLGIPAE